MSVDQQASDVSVTATDHSKEEIKVLTELLNSIKTLSETIIKHVSNRYEPVEDLSTLNGIFESRNDEVWKLLHTPSHLLSGQTEEQDGLNQDIQDDQQSKLGFKNLKLDFYEHVL